MSDTNSAYSPLKIFHHQDILKQLQHGKHIAPVRIQLIPTNRCNHRCEGCAYRLVGYSSSETFNDQDQLSWTKLKEIVRDCVDMGVKAIEITGGGEPTMHAMFLALCELILTNGLNLGVVTNGSIWSQAHTDILSQCQWVRFSIDAGCDDTYAKYRHTSTEAYYRVREHLRQLTSAPRAKDNIVGVGFVMNAQNWREVIQGAHNARQDGADNYRISALFQPQGWKYFEDFANEARVLCNNAAGLNTDEFRVFNLFGERLYDLLGASPDYSFCGYSRLTTYLGADYKAYMCCINAYNTKGVIGSFEDQSFRDMWESTQTQERLRALDARNCPRCMYNSKNQSIAYATEPTPLHVNFI